ncbi:hypothetical protein [Bifidobacterium simiarum]|uniref:hypothetical protein n=1 Tax=Bifidobacterium simiarum TaxID=2045441 RepID=UPI001BDC3132|nr:hypothetical protein [Bifidobacterium simiarum]MBT1165480.1 hypothetical protein [Bifidobacterium simiarum]
MTMVKRTSGNVGKSGKTGKSGNTGKSRNISKQQQAIYRRRRIVVAVLLVVALALCGGIVFGVVSAVRGLTGGSQSQSSQSSSQSDDRSKTKSGSETDTKDSAKDSASSDSASDSASDTASADDSASAKPKKTAGIPDCTASDVDLSLTAQTAVIGVGGTVTFKAAIDHRGDQDCLIDSSTSGLVLTISSGDKQIWQSDSCPADSNLLLMHGNDKYIQSITWNANSSGSKCVADADLPKVSAGTYTATVSLRDAPKAESDQLSVTVQ